MTQGWIETTVSADLYIKDNTKIINQQRGTALIARDQLVYRLFSQYCMVLSFRGREVYSLMIVSAYIDHNLIQVHIWYNNNTLIDVKKGIQKRYQEVSTER